MTLGTVEQLPDYEAPVKTKTLDSLWLGAEETEPVYGTVYDESVLDFPGAAYVHGPRKAHVLRGASAGRIHRAGAAGHTAV